MRLKSLPPSARLPLCVALACIYSSSVHALPQNPTPASGSVNIVTTGNDMQINQTTDKAIINWQKFGVAPNESVTFSQPSRSSIALNRVTGTDPSALDGVLKANGQVFIINPNGVLFGPTARVTVGGLLASTLDIDNHRFLASDYGYTGKGGAVPASVVNAGTITAVDGGYIVMLSNRVQNTGNIDAPSGQVLMGAGSQATLYLSKQSLLGYRIDSGSAGALVQNTKNIRADGGTVSLVAKGLTGADQLASAAVNNSGIIEAKTLRGQPGAIVLSGDMQSGRVSVTGTLDASAAEGNGGKIDTSAATVAVSGSARISTDAPTGTTGLWTITAANPIVGRTTDSINNAVLGTTLDKSNVTVIAAGSGEEKTGILSVNEEIASQGSNKLAFKAAYNLIINAPVAVGSGGLVLYADMNGTSAGKINFGSDARLSSSNGGPIDLYTNVARYTDTAIYDGFITSPYTLWMLVNNASQLQQIESNVSGNYAIGKDIDAAETRSWNNGAGFTPIANSFGKEFKGKLDGQNHVITNLTINRPASNYVGLFAMSEGEVKNLGLVDAYVSGAWNVGTFAGSSAGTLENVYATGEVHAAGSAGGLVGVNHQGFTSTGRISNAYSGVNVDGGSQIGGIAGFNMGTIENAYATGEVSISANPESDTQSGGIVGYNYFGAHISNAYWTTDGTGQSAIAGANNGFIDVASLASNLSNETLKTAPLNLDFNTTWFRYDGRTAPLLTSFLKPLTISGISRQIDKVYSGEGYDEQMNFVYSNPDAALSSHLNFIGNSALYLRRPNVGTYTNDSSAEFWSDQQGYLIENPIVSAKTVVTIRPRSITIQANSDTKTFDYSSTSSVTPGVSAVQGDSNMGLANGDVLTATQSFDASDVGDRTLKVSMLEIKNYAGRVMTSNYQISKVDASGRIDTVKPDPGPIPDGGPGTVPVPPKGNPGEDGGGGAGTGGSPNNPGPGTSPGGSAGGGNSGDGSTGGAGGKGGNDGSGGNGGTGANGSGSPSSGVDQAQRFAGVVAFLNIPEDDEEMKKRLGKTKLKNDYTFSIRNGGIRIPGEIFKEN